MCCLFGESALIIMLKDNGFERTDTPGNSGFERDGTPKIAVSNSLTPLKTTVLNALAP